MKSLVAIIVLTISFTIFAEVPSSFTNAKNVALKTIYKDNRQTFYCGCSYDTNKFINSDTCKYTAPTPPPENKCSKHDPDHCIEWEHVTPASQIGKHLSCWGSERKNLFPECVNSNGKVKSGRDCCQKVNPTFKDAHNDLVNLTPAIGALNRSRSDDFYGLVEGEERYFGQCDFESPNEITEPKEEIRGDIARIQLYMIDTYGGKLGFQFEHEYMDMIYKWAAEDPISDWEIERNKRICKAQGKGNRFVGEC